MKPAIPLPSFCRPAILALAAACLCALPAIASAADATNEVGVRWLEAELLTSKTTLLKAKCDPLVIAVGKTTLAHPDDALAILDAALTRRVHKIHRDDTATLPCTCARRIFLASLAAAPKRSSDFLDLATQLYPDCTPEFADAISAFNLQGQFDNFHSPADGAFGVGFPGAPGFTGSTPSGASVIPPPVVVTAVVNG